MEALRKKEIKKLFKQVPKREQQLALFLENIQYARNVAGMFRTADAAGVRKIYLSGISKQPPFGKELRQVSRHKEKSIPWEYVSKEETAQKLQKLKREGYFLVAVEIAEEAKPISELAKLVRNKEKVCFIAGSEVYGVTRALLKYCDAAVYIPMYGKGASLNVTASVAIALYSF